MNTSNAVRAEILTQAVPYIKEYTGKYVVAKYGGNAMTDPQLKKSVMQDILLLQLVGVKVILVHGGGPEISAMLKKYVDDVAIAVVVWGPGIHLLAKQPKRPVPELHQQRARSMAQSYGVRFIACGNTMHTVGWTAADMLDFAEIEEVGAAAVMALQERGYAYLAW